jgi:two-component sensor histidine kinase/PAS domain-containing protein
MVKRNPGIGGWLLKPRAAVIVIVFLFVLLLGITALIVNRQYKELEEQVMASEKTMAALVASLVLEHEKAAIVLLQAYASRPLVVEAARKRDVAVVRRHMADLAQNNDEIDLTFMTGPDGVLWVNFPVFPEAIGKDLSYRNWYKGVSARWKPYVSTVFKLIVGDKPLAVAVAVPVVDGKGTVTNILASSMRLTLLADTLGRIPLPAYTNLSLVDQAGNLIYSNRFSYTAEITAYAFFPAVRQAMAAGKEQAAFLDPRSNERFYATIVAIKPLGWTVIAGHTTSGVLKSGYRRFVITITGLLLLFVTLSFFLLYARKQTLLNRTRDRLRVEETLREELAKSRDLLNQTGMMAKVGGWEVDAGTLEVNWTEETCRIHEVPPDYKPSLKKAIEFFHPEDREKLTLAIQRALDRGEPYDMEIRFVTAKGKDLWTRTIGKPQVVGGRTVRLSGAFQDITERRLAEDGLKASLHEKEVLLKEIHHRVKNNLQIVTSLLGLQLYRLHEEEALAAFRDSIGRIDAMSLIHEQLYKSRDLARIDFGAYVKEAAGGIFRAFGVPAETVRLTVDMENMYFDVGTAIPCGLIVNELVSNALKHAFPGERPGEIRISLNTTGEETYVLEVTDTGIGLPEGFNVEHVETLGLKLATALVRQLEGTFETGTAGGASFRISFPKRK